MVVFRPCKGFGSYAVAKYLVLMSVKRYQIKLLLLLLLLGFFFLVK